MFMCARLVALNGVHMSVYVQLSEHTQACWCLHVSGGATEKEGDGEGDREGGSTVSPRCVRVG